MDGTCNKHGWDEKLMKNFNRKTQWEGLCSKTMAKTGRGY
jgi:hypothetical protein